MTDKKAKKKQLSSRAPEEKMLQKRWEKSEVEELKQQQTVSRKAKRTRTTATKKKVDKKQVAKKAASKKAQQSFSIGPTSRKQTVASKQKKIRAKPTVNTTKKKTHSRKKNIGKKRHQFKFGKYVIRVNKRFILTIILSVVMAGLIVGTVATVMRYGVMKVSDNAVTGIEENQTIVVDRQARITRYDLIAFHLASSEYNGDYVRQVVGLPGDSIWVENETVFVNGSLDEAISLRPFSYASQLPAGTFMFTTSNRDVLEELGGYSNIPSESYLVLADIDSDVSDSRSFGLVSLRNIQGVVTRTL